LSQTVLACLTGLLATLALVLLLSPLARRIGLVDAPHAHKLHEGEVPLVGGIAMLCGFLFAVLAVPVGLTEFRPLFAGLALLTIVGLLDDFNELGAYSRFAAQIGAGLFMVLWGHQSIVNLGPLVGTADVLPGAWVIPFTLFSVVGVINALNMQDGMDGLAGSQACLAFLILGATALAGGATAQATVLLVLASVTLGFLAFNLRLPGRPRALVFMGDAGSLFLGLALAWFVVDLSQAPVRTLAPVTALWILAIPLMDTVCILFRRLVRGRSPFLADREHLHHLLQAAGLGVSATLALILLAAAGLAAIGLAAERLGVPERWMFAAFLGLFGVYAVTLDLAWRRLGGPRRPV
jgi:UDP-GlcNAc:undecaprenyl-phosphate/decaprenyl-phosphate GlcNAc-1-phosphate transferase